MSNATTLTMEQLMAHSGWLRRLAGGLLADPAAADDAVQDALITAMRRPPDTRGSVRGWFGTVLTNRVRSDARHAGRQRAVAARAAQVPEAVPTPEEVVAGLELQRLIASLLLELGEPYRQVVYMRFYDDLDSSAIAARLGISAGTVRWRLKMALGELRNRLDQNDGEGGRSWRRLLAPFGPAGAAGAGAATPGFVLSAMRAPITLVATGALAVAVLGGAAVVAGRFDGGDLAGRAESGRMAAVDLPAGAPSRPPVFLAAPSPPSPPSDPGAPAGATTTATAAPSAAPSTQGQAPPAAETWSRLAPFTGVRWRGDVPEVEAAGSWAELVSIDGIEAGRIVAFCKQRYPRPEALWRKRFSEDLVDVLTGMGKPPGAQVVLEVKSLSDGKRRTVEASMTKENRRRVWERNMEPGPAPGSIIDVFARVSPFTGLKFRGEAIDVEVDGGWYRLVAVNGVTAERLVAFAKQRFEGRWQKRVAEDLVEVLGGMKVNVGTKVDLQLEELASKKRVERRDVPLTEANRQRVKQTWTQTSDKP
jgi:RNA polymerase sigma factor (sigma-70 family)